MSDISENELNAFADGQLGTTDRARILEALGRDPGLQTRMAEIQQTRNLLRLAYQQPPLPRVRQRIRGKSKCSPIRFWFASASSRARCRTTWSAICPAMAPLRRYRPSARPRAW